MIRAIEVRGLRSLRHVRLELGQLNVLIGPNQLGKTNVLDALSFLASATSGHELLLGMFVHPDRDSAITIGGVTRELSSFTIYPGFDVRARWASTDPRDTALMRRRASVHAAAHETSSHADRRPPTVAPG